MPLHTTRDPVLRALDIVDHEVQSRLDEGEDIFEIAATLDTQREQTLEEFHELPSRPK